MDKERNKKLNFKEKTKEFIVKHKKAIIGTASVGTLIAIAVFLVKKGYGSNESYDMLLQKREDIRMNSQSKTLQSDLLRMDRQISKITNPRREYCKSLTNDELENHIQSARSIWESAKDNFDIKTKGLSYDQYYKDPEKIELDKLYDSFYQAISERDYRHAMANPDKYPIHREHGYYLPNDD